MTILSLPAEAITTPQAVETVESYCLRRRLNSCQCTACQKSCQHDALRINGHRIQVDADKCTGCGRCAALCPSETFHFPGQDLFQTLQTSKDLDQVVFTCCRQNQAYSNGIVLPCLGILSSEALLFLGLAGPASVFFNATGCSSCINNKTAESFLEDLAHIQSLPAPLMTTEMTVLRNSEQAAPLTSRERRSFLFSVRDSLVSAVKKRYKRSPPSAEEHPANRRVPLKNRLVQQVIAAAGQTEQEALLALCTHQVSVNRSCTFCPRCTGICPTGALKLVGVGGEKELTFTGTKCSGCGLCLQFCDKNALTIQYAWLTTLTP